MGFAENMRLATRFRLPKQQMPDIEQPDTSPYAFDGPPSPYGMRAPAMQAQPPVVPGVRNNYYPHGMDVVFQPPASDQLRSIKGVPGWEELLNPTTPYQKEQLSLEKKKFEQSERFGAEKLNLQQGQLDLNNQKSDQIYQTKVLESERRMADATAKLELANRALALRGESTAAQEMHREAVLAATNARHALELAQKDTAHQETVRNNNEDIRVRQRALDDAARVTTQTNVDPTGRSRTETTTRGPQAPQSGGPLNGSNPNAVEMIGPDGKTYFVPKNRVAEARRNNMAPKSEMKK